MALIPLYEKYRDKGFTVLGVAREASSDKAMRMAIERDGYPWINLIELNDTNNIWKNIGPETPVAVLCLSTAMAPSSQSTPKPMKSKHTSPASSIKKSHNLIIFPGGL